MKTNKEILEKFGQKIIEEGFDPTLGQMTDIRRKENIPLAFKDYGDFFKKLNEDDFIILKRYFQESLGNFLFDVLRIFEENDQFKLIYEEEGKQVNLVEISEMLKSEPIIENGWIERFSKEI